MAKRKPTKDDDTYSYRGWLVSDKFSRRMWAVFGYNMAAAGVIYACILAVVLVGLFIALLFGLLL